MAGNDNAPEIRFKGFTDPWEQRKLGELCAFSKGHGYSKADIREAGTPLILYGRLYTHYESRIEDVDTFAIEQDGSLLSTGNEVIVPASGETAEDIAVASSVRRSGIILGGDLNVVTPGSELDPDFTALAITYSKAHDDLAKRAQGKSVVHVHGDDIADVEISYPPQCEQKRISTAVLNLDSLITLHQRKHEKLVQTKKAMLDKMFPKPGEQFPEIRFKGFTDPWEQRKLGELASEFQSGEFIAASNIYDAGPYPVYGGNGLRGYTDTFNHEGFYALIGRQGALCGNVNSADGKSYFTEHAVAVQANQANDTGFLVHLLGTMNLGQYSGQSAQPGLAVGVLKEVETLTPTKEEQRQIAAFMTSLDSLITLHQRKYERLKRLKAAMLDKMFV